MQTPVRNVELEATDFGFKCQFTAMASPCEVLVNATDEGLARNVGHAVAKETWRIEDKYSRYQSTSICSNINQNAGKPTTIDEETFKLLQFADQCYQLSEGMFDITSGVLRKCWVFNGGDIIPTQDEIDSVLPLIGWEKVSLTANCIELEPKMEVDFGGIGKEYAVDRSLQIASSITNVPILINFGGDLASTEQPNNGKPWRIGIEPPGFAEKQPMLVSISKGAIATSGDANRFLLSNGVRYSHILNPKNGKSITNGPKSVTISAPNCIQAGFIATLALLQGKHAEQFLIEQEISHWCFW